MSEARTLVWCLGMYGSASTWVYNVVLKLLGAAGAVSGAYVVTAADLAAARAAVIKTHQVDAEAGVALAARSRVVLASIRDPRDAVASMMQYMHQPFDAALHFVALSAREVARRVDAATAPTLLLRYESGFPDDPGTVARIATALGVAPDAAMLARIRTETTRASVEAHVRSLDTVPTARRDPRNGDVVDLATQWHGHHAGRTGEIGRWRHWLTVAQGATVEARLAEWMVKFGYETDFGGAPALPTSRGTPM